MLELREEVQCNLEEREDIRGAYKLRISSCYSKVNILYNNSRPRMQLQVRAINQRSISITVGCGRLR